jgi:hypothetical protein
LIPEPAAAAHPANADPRVGLSLIRAAGCAQPATTAGGELRAIDFVSGDTALIVTRWAATTARARCSVA